MNRTVLLVLTACLLALSGCSGVPGTSTGTQTGTQTPSDPLVQSGPGDYAHDVLVTNAPEDVAITVVVERNGTDIFEDTATVPADERVDLAGFTRWALPEDDRVVTVTATDEFGGSASVEVAISECLGDIEFFYDEDDLQGTYSIC